MTVRALRSRVASLLTPASQLRRRGFGEPYTPDVFQHFLSLERQRARQAKRLLLLVSISVEADGQPRQLSPLESGRIVDALAHSVREVDFIGWIREGFVLAAVLVQGRAGAGASVRVGERITGTLFDRLPEDLHGLLRVRIDILGEGGRQ